MAGDRNVKSSYVLSKRDALELFPMLKGDKLVGAIVYYDGECWSMKLIEGIIKPKNNAYL